MGMPSPPGDVRIMLTTGQFGMDLTAGKSGGPIETGRLSN